MKNALKTAFNHLSMGFRLLHATHIKKDRQTYLTYLESAYGLHRGDIVDYSRDELRQIFNRCNRSAAFSAYQLGLAGIWASGGVATALGLTAATSPWAPVVYGVLAIGWAGLALMETKNIHKKAEDCLSSHKDSEKHKIFMDELRKRIDEKIAQAKSTPADDKNNAGAASLSLRSIARRI